MKLCRLQLFYLSAILTVFFSGIVMSHYTWHNVTESSRVTTKYVCTTFGTLLMECVQLLLFLPIRWFNPDISSSSVSQARFCYIIIYCWNIHIPLCWYGCFGHWEVEICKRQVNFDIIEVDHLLFWLYVSGKRLAWLMVLCFNSICSPQLSVQVSSILLGLVLVGRAAFVFPLSFLSNLMKKSPEERISFNQQVCANNLLVTVKVLQIIWPLVISLCWYCRS